MVDSGVLRAHNACVQHRWRGTLVAWLRTTETRGDVRKGRLANPWSVLVAFPFVHATYAVGYGPDGRHGPSTLLRCATHSEYVARDSRPQFWQSSIFSEPGSWSSITPMTLALQAFSPKRDQARPLGAQILRDALLAAQSRQGLRQPSFCAC